MISTRGTDSSDQNSEQTLLTRCGYHLSLDSDEDLQYLGGRPLFARAVKHQGAHDQFTMQWGREKVFPSDRPQLANLGLYEVLRRQAELLGNTLRITASAAIKWLPAPAGDHLRFPDLPEFMIQNHQGLICHSKSVKPADIIRDVHQAFPEQRIMVISPRRQRNSELFRQLRPVINSIHLDDPKRPLNWSEAEELPRVIISTPYGVHEYEFPSTDIVILLEARYCCHSQTRDMLSQIDLGARVYGLHPRRFELSPHESDMCMVTFGPQQLELCDDSKVTRPAHLVRIPFLNRFRKQSKDIGFAKSLYWQNRKRNKQITEFAEELLAGTGGKFTNLLSSAGWELPEDRPNITILVDRPMHAVELSDRLNDWPVLIDPTILNHLNGQFRNRVRNQSRSWTSEPANIMLTDYARNASIEDVDILIWAAGTPHTTGIPERFLRSAPARNKPLLIIDFEDRGNPDTLRFSNLRAEEFYRRGIFPPGISPPQGRVALFLSNQPR